MALALPSAHKGRAAAIMHIPCDMAKATLSAAAPFSCCASACFSCTACSAAAFAASRLRSASTWLACNAWWAACSVWRSAVALRSSSAADCSTMSCSPHETWRSGISWFQTVGLCVLQTMLSFMLTTCECKLCALLSDSIADVHGPPSNDLPTGLLRILLLPIRHTALELSQRCS